MLNEALTEHFMLTIDSTKHIVNWSIPNFPESEAVKERTMGSDSRSADTSIVTDMNWRFGL